MLLEKRRVCGYVAQGSFALPQLISCSVQPLLISNTNNLIMPILTVNIRGHEGKDISVLSIYWQTLSLTLLSHCSMVYLLFEATLPLTCKTFIRAHYALRKVHALWDRKAVCVSMSVYVWVQTYCGYTPLDSPLLLPKGSPHLAHTHTHTQECPSHVLITPPGTEETTASSDLLIPLHHKQPLDTQYQHRSFILIGG